MAPVLEEEVERSDGDGYVDGDSTVFMNPLTLIVLLLLVLMAVWALIWGPIAAL